MAPMMIFLLKFLISAKTASVLHVLAVILGNGNDDNLLYT